MGYGFGSLRGVPYLCTYENALSCYNGIKPIRGTDNERRLGDRRYRQLRIEKRDNGDVQCWLYRTPVVTFKPEGTVIISPESWTSHFTCGFIEAVLPGVSGRHVRGRMVMSVRGSDQEFVVDKGSQFALRWNMARQKFDVEQAQGTWVWRVNRTAANKVRAPAKKFLSFYKGFVALNAEHIDTAGTNYKGERDPFTVSQLVRVSLQLCEQVLGTRQQVHSRPVFTQGGGMTTSDTHYTVIDRYQWGALANKPVWQAIRPDDKNHAPAPHAVENRARWISQRDYVYALMCSDEPEAHLKATLILLCLVSGVAEVDIRAGTFVLARSAAEAVPSDLLTKWFAEDVLEYVQLPVGKVPKTHYNSYQFAEVAEDKIKAATGGRALMRNL